MLVQLKTISAGHEKYKDGEELRRAKEMLYGLTKEDLQRIDKDGVKELIKANEERLKIWSISNYEKKQIEEENRQLKELL